MIATPSAAAIAIGACCTRLRASVVKTKSDVARATRSRPVMSAARRRRTRALACHASGRRERRTHLLPVAAEGDGNRAGDRQRKHDERVLREAGDRGHAEPRITLEERGEPGNRRRHLPGRGRHHHEAEDGAEKHELQQRAHRRGGMRADEQHEQSSNDDKRAEHEDRAANRARQVSRKVAKDVTFDGLPVTQRERQTRYDVDGEAPSRRETSPVRQASHRQSWSPRSGRGPSTIASRLSNTSVSQMNTVSRPVEIIEYDTNSTAICARNVSMSCGMFLCLATITIIS